MLIGETVPDFCVAATHGHSEGLHFHEYARGHWSCLFSHPADFTPVCTTELAAAQSLSELLPAVKFLAVSTDSLEAHEKWLMDIEQYGGKPITFPIIADTTLAVCHSYGMLQKHTSAAPKQAVRTVFLIRPDLSLAASIAYPMTVGRSFVELERVLRALMVVEGDVEVATPADWVAGDKVLVRPGVAVRETDEQTDLSYVTFRKV